MVNIPYLLKILNTEDSLELAQNIDLPALDINLSIHKARDEGSVEVDREKGTVKITGKVKPSCDELLAAKLFRMMEYYADEQKNITRGRLNFMVKAPGDENTYPWHEYLMALQWLIDTGRVIEYEIDVPESKKKNGNPYHKFVFLGIATNDEVNEEWNTKEVQKWLDTFEKSK